jgi:hypothetical protein
MSHSGDMGDLLYAIPTMRAICSAEGEQAVIYFSERDWTRSKWSEELFGKIEPLLSAQDFVEDVVLLRRNSAPESPFVDFTCFRNGGYKLGDTIVERQRRWLGAQIDISKPWLTVSEPTPLPGRIVINRASRWLGFHFPWKEIVAAKGEELLFIGLPSEHEAFCQEFGEVDYVYTIDLLEAGKLIAGADFFIGSQSAPNAIANGLHKASLLEVCCYAPDCFLPRENASYSIDGAVSLPELGLDIPPFHPPRGFVAKVGGHPFRSTDQAQATLMARAQYSSLRVPPFLPVEAHPYSEDLVYAR